MFTQHVDDAPVHERGGQSSYLLLAAGQFSSQNLAITWVDCPPGSSQPRHQHDTQEQIYVIVRGRGVMTVGDEERELIEGTLVFVPPATAHTIRNESGEPMCYVSATSPPFQNADVGVLYKARDAMH
jgi:mannose-6-phosphate isomerase-like protein (cupin superfamily)